MTHLAPIPAVAHASATTSTRRYAEMVADAIAVNCAFVARRRPRRRPAGGAAMSADQAVRRVHTETGSHIEPPLDQDATPLEKLRWHAAVVKADTGLTVAVSEHFPPASNRYSIQVGHASMTAHDFTDAWTLINGIGLGAEAARGDADAP